MFYKDFSYWIDKMEQSNLSTPLNWSEYDDQNTHAQWTEAKFLGCKVTLKLMLYAVKLGAKMATEEVYAVPPVEFAVSFHSIAVLNKPSPWIIKLDLLAWTTTFSLHATMLIVSSIYIVYFQSMSYVGWTQKRFKQWPVCTRINNDQGLGGAGVRNRIYRLLHAAEVGTTRGVNR